MNIEARMKELSKCDGISLRAAMKRLKLTQRKIAAALGVTESAVSMGFNEHRVEMRKRIINFLVNYEQPTVRPKSRRTKLRAA